MTRRSSATSKPKTAAPPSGAPDTETPPEPGSPSSRGTEDETLELASGTDLGPEEDWTEVSLRRLKKRVQVRYAGTHEIAYLSLLPDMADFATIAAKAALEDAAGRETDDEEKDPARFTAENIRWRQRLAHLVVMVPGEEAPKDCSDCGMKHPPSLWSTKQTARLHGDDLLAIVEATLSVREFRTVRPFLKDQTPTDSPAPVDTSE